jgi:hypothetical protein
METHEQAVMLHRATDAHGRILPISPEERRVRSENLRRMIERLAAAEFDPDDGLEDVYRSIDNARPERKLFEGMY